MRRSTSGLEARIAAARAATRPVRTGADDVDSELDFMDADSPQQKGQQPMFAEGDDPQDDSDVEAAGGEPPARTVNTSDVDSDLGSDDGDGSPMPVDGDLSAFLPIRNQAVAIADDDPEYGQDERFRVDLDDCNGGGAPANAADDVTGQRAHEAGGVHDDAVRSSRLVVPEDKALKVYAYADVPQQYRSQVDDRYKQRLKARENAVAKNRGPDWTDAEKLKVRNAEASKFMATRHLSRPLPVYKHAARELTVGEREAMSALRRKIDCALRVRPMSERPGDGPAPRQAAQAHRRELLAEALENDGEDVQALEEGYDAFRARVQAIARDAGVDDWKRVAEAACAEVARAPLLTEPNDEDKQQLAQLAQLHGVTEDAMIDEYMDFMNEARRHILRTIRLSNNRAAKEWEEELQSELQRVPTDQERYGYVRPSRQQLSEEMEADTAEEFRELFERETDAPPRPSRGGGADGAGPSGAGAGAGATGSCSGLPMVVISWNALEDVGTDPSATTPAQERVDEGWVRSEVSGATRHNEVRPLWQHNNCTPCLPWAIPKVGEEGFWKAARRIRTLKGEVSMSVGTKDVPKWEERLAGGTVVNYNGVFDDDPLVNVKETWGPGKVVMMDQLIRKYFQQVASRMPKSQRERSGAQTATPDNNYTHNNVRLTMLRCFPVRKDQARTPAGLAVHELNPIVDFVCWWHKNITEPGTVYDPKAPDEPHAEKTNAKRNSLFYRLMCAPDCKTAIKHNGDKTLKEVDNWRANMQSRVAVIRKYFEMLKIAMDVDVFEVDRSESLLYNGHGYHAQLAAAAQTGLDKANAALAEATQSNKDVELAQRVADAAKTKRDAARTKLGQIQDVPQGEKDAARAVYETWRRYNPDKA